ncbi:MAG: septal ring lytic transglycosylase RlpA family protein, partial [Alteripontixanthobacter sp.]
PIEEESETTARSIGAGMASYYGRRFHGRRTANGERFDMHAMTAAHKTLPFGTLVEVTNPNNGRSVTVRINDRGPFIRGRTIDLSRAAASEIGIIQRGHGKVALALVE